jgi:hypothetical protein
MNLDLVEEYHKFPMDFAKADCEKLMVEFEDLADQRK